MTPRRFADAEAGRRAGAKRLGVSTCSRSDSGLHSFHLMMLRECRQPSFAALLLAGGMVSSEYQEYPGGTISRVKSLIVSVIEQSRRARAEKQGEMSLFFSERWFGRRFRCVCCLLLCGRW